MDWGSVIGGGLGALGSLFGPKPPKPEPRYHGREAQDLLYGLTLGSLGAWGSPISQMYLQTQPKRGQQFMDLFGGGMGGGGGGAGPGNIPFNPNPGYLGSSGMDIAQRAAQEKGVSPGFTTGYTGPMTQQGSGGGAGGQGFSFGPSGQGGMPSGDDAIARTLEFMRTPRVRFGYGGGNMGSWTGGYGGPLT